MAGKTEQSVCLHKLDVAKERCLREVERCLRAEDYDKAHATIDTMRGINRAIDVILAPDSAFDQP